jgi:hypothetical protein
MIKGLQAIDIELAYSCHYIPLEISSLIMAFMKCQRRTLGFHLKRSMKNSRRAPTFGFISYPSCIMLDAYIAIIVSIIEWIADHDPPQI